MPQQWRVIIEDWKVVNRSTSTDTPQFSIEGKVFNHPRFTDGSLYYTSRISCWYPHSKRVITSSGVSYMLGSPNEEWAKENIATCKLLIK